MAFKKACRRRFSAALALGMLFTLAPGLLLAQDARQYKIEAAYLYNFFNYITWPGMASPKELKSPTICVYRPDPIEFYLKYLQQKKAAEKQIEIRIITENKSLKGCNLIFSRYQLSRKEMREAHDNHVLTVSNLFDPLDRGGRIELLQQEDRIAITINQTQLEKEGFQLSSRLLNIAQEVR